MRTWACIPATTLFALMLAACAVPEVELVATIELGPPMMLVPQGLTGPDVPSIGIVDGNILALWSENRALSLRLGLDVYGQWFTSDGARMGGRFFLGHSTGIRFRMAPRDGALHFAFVGNGPTDNPDENDDERLLRVAQVRPGEAPTLREVVVNLAERRVASSTIGNQGWRGGVPARDTPLGVHMMVEASADVDGCFDSTGAARGFLLNPDSTQAEYAQWNEPVCAENAAGSFALVHTSGPSLGWVFRSPRGSPHSVYYAQIDPAHLPSASAPTLVGGDPQRLAPEGLPQLFAAYAGQGRIVVAHHESDYRISATTCYRLRVLDDDGSHAHDAPWQLPCLREGFDRWVTPLVDLEETSHGALLAWSERSGPRDVGWGTDPVATVRLRVALLTPNGTRGSEIIDVVRHDDSLPVEYAPMLAVDGEDIVVSYFDPLADPPGLYARRVTLTATVQ